MIIFKQLNPYHALVWRVTQCPSYVFAFFPILKAVVSTLDVFFCYFWYSSNILRGQPLRCSSNRQWLSPRSRTVKYLHLDSVRLNMHCWKVAFKETKNLLWVKVKGKSVPLQAWSGPEGSRKLRFPDFMTTAQDGGKVVSLTHRQPLPPGNIPGTHFC